VVEAHDTIAGLPFCYAGANGNDSAREFVTQDLWRLDVTLENFLDVGTADAASGDFDQDFVIADFGHGYFFDANDSFFAIDASAHGFGDGAEGV
jgi:hypothetical protein